MSTIPPITNLNDLLLATQTVRSNLVDVGHRRSYQLEVLFQSLKVGNPIESIMQAIAILDKQEAQLRDKQAALTKAHQEAHIAQHIQRIQASQ